MRSIKGEILPLRETIRWHDSPHCLFARRSVAATLDSRVLYPTVYERFSPPPHSFLPFRETNDTRIPSPQRRSARIIITVEQRRQRGPSFFFRFCRCVAHHVRAAYTAQTFSSINAAQRAYCRHYPSPLVHPQLLLLLLLWLQILFSLIIQKYRP